MLKFIMGLVIGFIIGATSLKYNVVNLIKKIKSKIK